MPRDARVDVRILVIEADHEPEEDLGRRHVVQKAAAVRLVEQG